MKVIAVLGSSGIGNKTHVEQAYRKELLPLVESFENGSPSEHHVFAACRKVHEAVVYVGANSDHSYGWPDLALNRLLRLEQVPAPLRGARSSRRDFGELLFDYQQIVDPAGFSLAYRLVQAREAAK